MKGNAVWITLALTGLAIGVVGLRSGGAQSIGSAGSTATVGTSGGHFKLALVLTQSDPETAFNAFRVAQYALEAGDDVSVFLLGKGVDLDKIQDAVYNVQEKAQAFQAAGGKILACGTCLQMHGSSGSKLCPISTMKDLYDLIQGSDRVVAF